MLQPQDGRRNVLIVAPGDDFHALAVKRRIAQIFGDAVQCTVFDTATFPIASNLDWSYEEELFRVSLDVSSALAGSIGKSVGALLAQRDRTSVRTIDRSSISGVWWRRGRSVTIHPDVSESEVHTFCSHCAVALLRAFFSSCTIYNRLDIEQSASSKAFQLLTASSVGLRIPKTLITGRPGLAREFVERMWRRDCEVIYKHVTSATAVGFPTRVVKKADLERLETLRFAPAIFQERITGGLDLRIAVLGKRIYTAEWRAGKGDLSGVDIRVAPGAHMSPGKCPSGLIPPLLQFHAAMGLAFGVYDFKLDERGTPFFLEVNPSGQWLDMEIDGGQPISESWARLLVGGTGSEHQTTLSPLRREELEEYAQPYVGAPISEEWVRII
jgi:glutathione synthase/RimK-type ligase-like ATP-grasp enzyme